MSCVASDRFRCPSLNVFFSDLLHQVIFFRPEMYIKKDLSFKWCYLLNDFSAFIFHSNVHLLSSTFWHMLIYMYLQMLRNAPVSHTVVHHVHAFMVVEKHSLSVTQYFVMYMYSWLLRNTPACQTVVCHHVHACIHSC